MIATAVAMILLAAVPAAAEPAFRPPSVPLVTHDPYFSVWSNEDNLTTDWTRHWSGAVQAMCSLVKIDGKPYRLMGTAPSDVPALRQTSVQVLPTRSVYTYEDAGIKLTLTFCSPLLPHRLDIASRPVTYITWKVRSTGPEARSIRLYFDASAEHVVSDVSQKVVWKQVKGQNVGSVRLGTVDQPVLGRAGDAVRIDWGYIYVGAPGKSSPRVLVTSDEQARLGFSSGTPVVPDAPQPRAASDKWPVAQVEMDLGEVGARETERHVLVAYDDIWSLEYMGKRLRPYWRKSFADGPALLEAAEKDYRRLMRDCEKFDAELMRDLEREGGAKYAQLCALALRQSIAGQKIVEGPDGSAWMYSKENSSNGCIGTVDVMYPACPLPLLFNPEMMRAQLEPMLAYASSPRWKHPFAPHDLGTYPLANGQVYGGGERTEENQMPVEESANMLLMVAALAKAENSADYPRKHWTVLTRWAEYLKQKGLDPENQLCTDDFAGHLAHNANLSAKAVLALGAYGQMCAQLGDTRKASEYLALASSYARQWEKMADDGTHYRLAFDQPGTWSMKYNLIWDRVLGLKLFAPEVIAKELAFYKTVQNRYGLPLDSRKDWSKLDWLIWTASLAPDRAQFEQFADKAYDFATSSPSRVPLSDWYDSKTGEFVVFRGRPVVGGLFIKMLLDEDVWRSWRRR